MQIFEGRYGPYVKHGSVNANVPKETDPASVTLEQALGWLAARASKGGGKSAAKRGTGARGAAKGAKKASKKATKKTVKKTAGTKATAKGAKKLSAEE